MNCHLCLILSIVSYKHQLLKSVIVYEKKQLKMLDVLRFLRIFAGRIFYLLINF